MNKEEIKQFIKDTISDFTNQNIPWHKHNYVDSPAIDSFDINTNNSQGFIFPMANGSASIQADYTSNNLVITENNADLFIISSTDTKLSSISFSSGNPELLIFVGDSSADTASLDLTPNLFLLFSTGDFAIQLPDTTRTSPVAGMIAFEAGQFYYCTTTGVWTPF